MKHKVTCLPGNNTMEIDEETPLLTALRERNVYVKSSCGGHASCSDCVIKIVEGENNINKPPFAEQSILGNVFFITKERLSCQTKITGPITIDVGAHDQDRDREKFLQKSANFKKRPKTKTPQRKNST